jgi:protein gp37
MMSMPPNFHAKREKVGIFACNMSDLFGIGIPKEWTRRVLDAIRTNGVDRFYLTTKQPQNLIKFSPFPENCWVGVTATNDYYFRKAIDVFRFIDAKVKFISFEPLLDWSDFFSSFTFDQDNLSRWLHGIGWLIIGAQTKPYKPPKIEWVREIVEAADKVGIKVFLKDNLKPLLGDNLRQELPK